MQPWRAIHLLAPDSWEAGVYFKTSFSLRRNILRGTHRKKPSRTAWVLASQPWPQGVRGWLWGSWGGRRGPCHAPLPQESPQPPPPPPGKYVLWNNSYKTGIIPAAPFVRKNHGLDWNQRHAFLHLKIKVSRCLPLQILAERAPESTKE